MSTTEAVLRILEQKHWREYERDLIRVCRVHPNSEIVWEGEARELARLFIEQRAEIDELQACIEGLAYQYGFIIKGRLCSGAISAMEEAFELLGWDDPRPAPPEMICDEDGCLEAVSCGWPSPTGYRRTCGKHYHAEAADEPSAQRRGGAEE